MIQPKMQVESCPKSSGGTPRTLVTDDIILNFLVLLSNLGVASDYTRCLITTFVNTSSNIPRGDGNSGMDASSDRAIPSEALFHFQTEPAIVRDALK